jgi:hypothetical protein
MTKLYVAGPMQNHPRYNFPAFIEASKALRKLGYEVISPEEKDKERNPEAWEKAYNSPDGFWKTEDTGGLTWAQILAGDIVIVSDEVDGIALLPGWEKSSGARLEAFVGLLRGKSFGFYHPDEGFFWTSRSAVRDQLMRNMP